MALYRTKGQLAKLSYQRMGISTLGSVRDITQAQLQAAMEAIESTALELDSDIIRLGYKLSKQDPDGDTVIDAQDEHGLPDWAANALAVYSGEKILQDRGREPTGPQSRAISRAYDTLVFGTLEMPQVTPDSSMVMGSGYGNALIYDNYYPEIEKEVTTREGQDLLTDD